MMLFRIVNEIEQVDDLFVELSWYQQKSSFGSSEKSEITEEKIHNAE